MHSLKNSGPPRHKRRLRNYLLFPRYQLRYSFWLSFTGGLIVAAVCGVAYFYLSENYSTLIELCPMTDEARLQMVGELRDIVVKLVLTVTAFFAVVSVMGIWLSHRTVGPLFHFRRVFSEVAQGNLSARVRLRPKDDFREIADDFNKMMDAIEKKKG